MNETYKTADMQFLDGSVLVELCGVPDEPVELGRYASLAEAETEHPDAVPCCPWCDPWPHSSKHHVTVCLAWCDAAVLPTCLHEETRAAIAWRERSDYVAKLWRERLRTWRL